MARLTKRTRDGYRLADNVIWSKSLIEIIGQLEDKCEKLQKQNSQKWYKQRRKAEKNG